MKNVVAVILAAGQSTRMNSTLSKLLHRVGDKYLVERPVEACEGAGVSRIVLVLGYQGEEIEALMGGRCDYVSQSVRRGTGDAVRRAMTLIEDTSCDILVMPGDAPFLQGEVLQALVSLHRRGGASATVLTAQMVNPAAYGRIVRDAQGSIIRIVEFKNATVKEKSIREVNSGVYCFKASALEAVLPLIRPNDVTGEEYLTDAVGLFAERGEHVAGLIAPDFRVVLGVNTPEDLAYAEALLTAGSG